MSKKSTAKKHATPIVEAPVMPSVDTSKLPLTDPRRKLTREDWASMTKEQRTERRAAKRASRGPVASRYARAMARQASRLAKIARAFKNEGDIHGTLMGISQSLRDTAGDVDELGAAWVPASKGGSVRAELVVGSLVTLVPSKLAQYTELLGEDVGSLTVVKVAGKRVVLQDASGVKIFLPVVHVKPAV